jgi:hypothetical protein
MPLNWFGVNRKLAHSAIILGVKYRKNGKPSAMPHPIDLLFHREFLFIPSHCAGQSTLDSSKMFAIFGFNMKTDPKNGMKTHDSPNRRHVVLSPSSKFAEGVQLLR